MVGGGDRAGGLGEVVGAQGGEGGAAGGAVGDHRGEVLAGDAVQDQRLLGGVVGEQRPAGDRGGPGDLAHRHVLEAAFGEQAQGLLGYAPPGPFLLEFPQSDHRVSIGSATGGAPSVPVKDPSGFVGVRQRSAGRTIPAARPAATAEVRESTPSLS